MQRPGFPDGGDDVVAAELELRRQTLLLARLQQLQRRQVPLRTVRTAPVAGSARLGFADGTVLLVQVAPRADVLARALFAPRCSIRVGRCWRMDDGPVLELVWDGGRLPLRVLGTDQPD